MMKPYAVLAVVALALSVSAAKRAPAGHNVKVLTDLEPEALYGAMLLVAASLGVSCDHCHSESGFERDEKPEKETARAMMRMVAGLRRQPATAKVTCYTCHRGHPRPVTVPPLDGAPKVASGTAPTVEEVLARHRQATADDARLGRLTTIVMKGHATFAQNGAAGEAHAVTIVARPPDRWARTDDEGGRAMTQAVNGAAGSRRIGDRVMGLGGIDLATAQREARFAAGDVAAPYAKLSAAGTATVRGAPAIAIDAVAREPRFGPLAIASERLYFDVATGLLVRRELIVHTAVGDLPFGTEYSDFRRVDGVQLPFHIDHLFPDATESLVIDDLQLDVPEDVKWP